jgi:single-stranded-DNA-specific exonuclease
MLVTVEDETGASRRVIWWGGGAQQVPEGLFDLAYTVRSSSYRGEAEIQVEWVDARLVVGQTPEVAAWQSPAEIIDYRQEINPFAALQPWLDEPGVQIWGEAQKDEQIASLNRYELSHCETLVIWTIPPGSLELQAAMKSSSPAKLILFAVSPGKDKLQPFLHRLAGLVKFAIKSAQGQVSIQSLAAACAQRTATVRAGLAWMQAAGHIRIMHQEQDIVWLGNGQRIPVDGLPEATRHLKSALEETAAYRAFYSRADVNAIIAI